MSKFDIIEMNDENVVPVICVDCGTALAAVRESECHIYQRCTQCVKRFEELWRRSFRES